MSSWLLARIQISNISSTCRNDVIRFLWESYVARQASSQLWAGQAPNCHSRPLSPSQLENPQGSQSQGVDPTTRTRRKIPQGTRFSVPSTRPLSTSHLTYDPQDRYLKSQKKVLKIAWPWPDGHMTMLTPQKPCQHLCVYDYVNSAKTNIYVDFCVYEYVDFAKTYISVNLCVYTKDHTQLANKIRKKRMRKWTWWEPVLRESRLLCHYRNNQYLDAIAILCPWFCKLLNVASSKPQTLQSLFLNLPVMMLSVQWHSCSQFQQQWNHCRLLLAHEHHHLWFLPLRHEHHDLGFLLHEHHHHPVFLLLFSHHHHHHHPFA